MHLPPPFRSRTAGSLPSTLLAARCSARRSLAGAPLSPAAPRFRPNFRSSPPRPLPLPLSPLCPTLSSLLLSSVAFVAPLSSLLSLSCDVCCCEATAGQRCARDPIRILPDRSEIGDAQVRIAPLNQRESRTTSDRRLPRQKQSTPSSPRCLIWRGNAPCFQLLAPYRASSASPARSTLGH